MVNQQETQHASAIAKLLKAMDASPGFASLGGAVRTISNLVDNDGDNKEIVAAILRDPALTSKLLSIANSSRYPRGAGNVSGIDQVLAILGLNTVKSVALSLALLNSLSNKPQSDLLHAEIVAGFFSGALAAAMTRKYGTGYSVQEAQVCGLVQNLGRMMATFYWFEGIELSRKIQLERNLAEDEAVVQALGASFEEIGTAIACHWDLPQVLQDSLAPDALDAPPGDAPGNAAAWQRMCSVYCRRMTNILFRMQEDRSKVELPRCIDFFQKAFRCSSKDALDLVNKCLEETGGVLADMAFPCSVEQATNLLRKGAERSTDRLSAHDSLVQKEEGYTPIEVVKYLMRQIHGHCGFDCTLICLISGGPSSLIAIAGIGRNAGMLTTKFRSGGVSKDIFQVILASRKDAFISDINAPAFSGLVPTWYHEFVKAKSCAMMPLISDDRLVGMVYGDYLHQKIKAPGELTDEVMQKWRKGLAEMLKAGPKAKNIYQPLNVVFGSAK